MGIAKKHSPGCSCCGECFTVSYPLTSSLADWTQQSGSWSIVTGQAQTTSGVGSVLLLTNTPTWSHNFHMRWTGSTTQFTRAYLGWQDSNNYFYIEKPSNLVLRIVEVSGGVSTVLLSDTVDSWSSWVVCYQNGFLQATSNNLQHWGSAFEVAIPNGQIGIGPSASGTYRMAGVTFEWNSAGSRVCETCLHGICCEGYDLPDEVTLVIDNLPAPYDVWNGSYDIPRRRFSSSRCEWERVNGLANIEGVPWLANFIRVRRDFATTPISYVELHYQKSDGTIIFISGSATLAGSWTTSPCYDQWSTPFNLSGTASGTVDSILGVF